MSSTGQIGSIICKNFAQNAWKKDLCSNCFKSEVEHQDSLLNSGSEKGQSIIPTDSSNYKKEDNNSKDSKSKKSSAHPTNLLSQTNISNGNNIKTLNINVNQTSNPMKNNKSVTDCQNTTTTILQSSKKTVNFVNNNSSPQILLNTKKINSTHVLSNNIADNCLKIGDKISFASKDNTKDNNLNNNSINNCLELRKVINSKVNSNSEANNDLTNTTKIVNNNCSNQTTKDPKQQNFPQLSATKEKLILSQTNVKNNNLILNNCLNQTSSQVLFNSFLNSKKTPLKEQSVDKQTMPLIGILKTDSKSDLIKYRSKSKCLVFKEGDPLVIGYGIEEEYSDEEEPEEEESDDFDDDEQIYYSDDKELRELTRENTKFNSNFANFSLNKLNDSTVKNCVNQIKQTIPIIDSKVVSTDNCSVNSEFNDLSVPTEEEPIVIDKNNDCETEVTIPDVCEKLVENSLIETFERIGDTNNVNNCESLKSQSPDSGNSDILPMSTSSDSYCSSSSDEKEDSIHSEPQTIEIGNFKTQLIITQTVKPLIDSKHLRTDSESDNSSNNSDSGLEITDYQRKQDSVKPLISRTKPQLPVKPNISTTVSNSTIISVEKQPTFPESVPETETKTEESDAEMDVNSGPESLADQIYEEISDVNEDLNGTEGTFKFTNSYESNQNISSVDEKSNEFEIKPLNEAKRDIKLAELAQELEQARHFKRPAPQPPVYKQSSYETNVKEDLIQQIEPIGDKQQITVTNIPDKKFSTIFSNPTTNFPIKPNRFSIKKLLHKKSDKSLSVKPRDHSNESHHSNSSLDSAGADRKAWKQSEFDRSNLKIIHPIDMTQTEVNKSVTNVTNSEKEVPEDRPEAPPRTPKPSRPSVPARRRKAANAHLLQPRGEPPPPPPPPPLNAVQTKGAAAEPALKANDLNEAYNQLAKSNHSNILAIKSKIESLFTNINYKWSDFDVTQGLSLGSALLYKDSIVSNSRKSVNLLVLSDCYLAPIVTQFRHHSDLVLVLDEQWTEYNLLSELSIESLSQKSMNSLILQLYCILENLETNNVKYLPNNTIDKIIISSSKHDCLLIVPIESSDNSQPQKGLTLHQFLAQVLTKLLPNSLFASLDSQVLSRPSVPMSQSKTIVQLIVFQIPVHQMSDSEDGIRQINYWFDINRSKFINQFCCLTVDTTKLLTQLDYNYLQFLCNDSIDLIRNSINLLVNTTNNTKNC